MLTAIIGNHIVLQSFRKTLSRVDDAPQCDFEKGCRKEKLEDSSAGDANDSVWENTVQEPGRPSAGVTHCSARGNPMRSFATRRRRTRRLLEGCLSTHMQSSLQKKTITQTLMEYQNPDVKFILEALVGSLMTLTAEGDLLLENQNFESKRKERGQSRVRLSHGCQESIRQNHTRSPTQCYFRTPMTSLGRRQCF